MLCKTCGCTPSELDNELYSDFQEMQIIQEEIFKAKLENLQMAVEEENIFVVLFKLLFLIASKEN